MAITLYGNYRITELRRYATEYRIKGRSKMTGNELLAAVCGYWDAQRAAAEQAVIGAVRIGALLRHKSAGYTIRVTSEVSTWEPYGALYVTAEYASIAGSSMNTWGPERDIEQCEYFNAENLRRTERGEIVRHPLWQYKAV